jgi:hypothetical protein
MKTPEILQRHWRLALGLAAAVILCLLWTREAVKVIGTVDVSGQDMTVNGA